VHYLRQSGSIYRLRRTKTKTNRSLSFFCYLYAVRSFVMLLSWLQITCIRLFLTNYQYEKKN